MLLPAQLTRAVLGVAQHALGVGRDEVDDALGLLAGLVEVLAGAQVRVGLDLLSLSAHEALEVVGLRRDALRVLERGGDLVVGVLRDALGVRDGLVVQHEELLLRVVLAARERLLELERAHAQLAHGLFGLGLKKIYLNTINTNIRNIRLNQELGFTIEGILHNEVMIDGVYKDVLRMSLWLE
ncbi:MAG: hypothetical protein BWY77_01251 [bacterium ADurb.Bin431]|nr:MAG: hypothetical protein BWY77_01251 [bacterium ADurb.Bin431]